MPPSHSPRPPGTDCVDQPSTVLAEQVRSVINGQSDGATRLVRLTVPLAEEIQPLEWVRAQDASEVVYWSDRTPDVILDEGRNGSRTSSSVAADQRTVGAIGAADVLTSDDRSFDPERLQQRLDGRFQRTDVPIRYYGGLRFDALASSSERAAWTSFGTYRFVLPRFEVVEEDERTVLACNLVLPRDAQSAEALLESIRSLTFPPATEGSSLPEPTDRRDRPQKAEWTDMVRWALEAIRKRRLDKVVLARRVGLSLNAPVDPLTVLQQLKTATPGCFHFALRPADGPTFLGAPPERLFRRRGAEVMSEAVAGTRERGETAEEDAALREELLTSAKERREHAFVQEAILSDLEGLCTSVNSPDTPSELALARGRHLHAYLTGTLRPEVSTVELLDALHPTPAVGGVPTRAALRAIREQEPFDRGWYAGPVGWIGPDAAEFAVAIRSGLVDPSRLALFSGAGIVEGSVPEREWDEIEQKIGDFAAVLGLLDSVPHRSH